MKQINCFEQGGNVTNLEEIISEDDVYYCLVKVRKMAWMGEKRIKLFMQMELDICRIS